MSRTVSPAIEQLKHLRTPLTPGEERVLEFFLDQLPVEWEIYIQPHMNGHRPDFVLLHPRVGIAVFEVKDWVESSHNFRIKTSLAGDPQLWDQNHDGVEYRVKPSDNPALKCLRYRQAIFELFCPSLGESLHRDPRFAGVVTAGVIMANMSTARANELLRPFLMRQHENPKARGYHPVSGLDALDARDLNVVFPEAHRSHSTLMRETFSHDLRSWLIEPDVSAEQREALELDAKQRKLVETRPENGFRRIRGPAGSGKSAVIAARAAKLASEGKDVLVVSFNITLQNYLRDLAVRHRSERRSAISSITWLNFHGWCKEVCYHSGNTEEYRLLWAEDNASSVLDDELPDLVETCLLEDASPITYDAILVDEGQDFELRWWNLLRKVCRDGGEMWLAADAAQDLYGRTDSWTEGKMTASGFTGRWTFLETSYRLPPSLASAADALMKSFCSTERTDPIIPTQAELNLEPTTLRWITVPEDQAVPACIEAILEIASSRTPEPVPFADITLLLDSNDRGLASVSMLEDKNIGVTHTFGTHDDRGRRARRLFFFKGDARVKASTIHSFKGWESRALVVYLSKASSTREKALLLTAITRLKRSTRGSYLTVVCSDLSLEPSSSAWERRRISRVA